MSGLTAEYIMRGEPKKDEVECYAHYSEPGYDATKGILLGNWNDFQGRTLELLNRAGYETEWIDEWSSCEVCDGLVRISGNSYDWQPSYVTMNECELICEKCLLADKSLTEEYLESLENQPNKAVHMHGLDPEKYGYTRVGNTQNTYERGLHTGMNDNPADIFANLSGTYKRLLFALTEAGQFYIEFKVYAKTQEETDNDTE